MSLLQEIFCRFSRFDFQSFVLSTDPILPLCLLRAEKIASGCDQVRLSAIRKALQTVDSGHYRNPEIYLALDNLAGCEEQSKFFEELNCLEVHLALREPKDLIASRAGYHRLSEIDGCLYRVRGNLAEVIAPPPWTKLSGFPGRIFLPFPSLFADFLSAAVYPQHFEEADYGLQLGKVLLALQDLNAYDASLSNDFNTVVSRIILTPDYRDDERWNYSAPSKYFGAVFVNVYRCGHAGLVEALIHEYCHQRLWQWWCFEPVDGMPGADANLVSPVTGRNRSVPVMMHALIIYLEALRYHMHHAAVSSDEPDSLAWARQRASRLSLAIPVLQSQLQEHALPGTRFSDILLFLKSEYERLIF